MGIGEATARAFSKAGAKLVMASHSADKLQAIARSLPGASLVVPTNIVDQTQVAALIEAAQTHFGRIDVLISNAAQAADGPVASFSPDHYHQFERQQDGDSWHRRICFDEVCAQWAHLHSAR